MKTVKFFASALLVSGLLVSTAFASDGDKAKSEKQASENSIREQLSNALSDVSSAEKGVVFIYFTVSSEKGFELLNVAGENKILNGQVKGSLNSESIAAPSELKGSYVVKVVFADKYAINAPVKATDVLRSEVSNALSKYTINENASVKLVLLVKDNNVSLTSVEGASKSLSSTIVAALNSSKITVPSELAGKYEINVQFQ